MTAFLFQLFFFVPAAAGEKGDPADLLIADFEAPDYGAWEVTGTAFGPAPARGALAGQMAVGGFLGSGLVNSFFGGDGSTGTLLSPPFTIERGRINFLIGGGNHAGETCIHLLVDGKATRSAAGPNSEFLRPYSWDVADLRGKSARIQIVDRHQGGWGHINIDHIVQSDGAPRIEDDRDAALARATESVKKAAERAERDPARPLYHFRAPGNWMNDPNGPIQHGGFFHVFYQHNPYGDAWGHMHWGHARSRDLVRWEHLPIALWPSLARGEEHCFSGCAALDDKGSPVIFYTSIGHSEPECWAAIPEDAELIRWKKHPASPVLKAGSAPVKLHEWRDPFVFRSEGRTFMVHGGNLNATKGGQAAVSLYEAKSADLDRWEFKSILFVHPDAQVKNIECPNFFPLGGKWVLITSPHRACDYFIGTFDAAAGNFRAERSGMADWSTNYYAPNCFEDSGGRRILWGWIKDFPGGRGWNGCFTLPRVLSIGADGLLRQVPAPEVETLRGEASRLADHELSEERPYIHPTGGHPTGGDSLEILAELERSSASRVALRLRRSADGARAVEIAFDGEKLEVAGVSVPLKLAESEKTLKLRIFLDRSVLEVYAADGRECITRVIGARPEDQGIELRATGGKAMARKVEIWTLKPIW